MSWLIIPHQTLYHFHYNHYMWLDLQKGVLYTHPIVRLLSGITLFISRLLSWNFLSYKSNDKRVLLSNFKVVGQTQAELYSLKVEKFNACIRPLFANPVTYLLGHSWNSAQAYLLLPDLELLYSNAYSTSLSNSPFNSSWSIVHFDFPSYFIISCSRLL